MDKTKQPGISFDGIILVEEKFWRDYQIPEDSSIDLEFQANNNIEKSSGTVEVYANFKLVKDEKSFLTLDLKFIGFFSVIGDEENMDIKEFIENNSLALMFPYIREHITNITSKSGIKPIVLPPINLRAVTNKEHSNL